MRKKDCFLNASQILTLTNKNPSDIEQLLQRIQQAVKVEVLPPLAGIASSSSWVSFEHGQIICKGLGLEQKLQPLVEYGLEIQRSDHSEPMEYINSVPKPVINSVPKPAINSVHKPV